MNEQQIVQRLRPLLDRPASSHKYDFGHVLVIGGAPGMVGAPLLAARAALRTGAGLATIASGVNVVDKLEKRVEEIMTLRLPTELGDFIAERKVSVLAIGPGLSADMAPLVKELVGTVQLPVILDAGGLAVYNGNLDGLGEAARRNPAIILTPHTGEFARLFGKETPEEAARQTNTTIVLKGHHSLVVGGGQHYTNQTGNPGLATAGTGDVLTGVIAGLAAQGLGAFEAAAAGVYLHGLAADAAAAAKTQPGMIASDVIEFIPAALKTAAG